jgi:Tol biopolymer transport system component
VKPDRTTGWWVLFLLLTLALTLAGLPALAASGPVELISRAVPELASDTPGGYSFGARMSADGRFVAYASTALNLVPGPVNLDSRVNIFLYDRVSGVTTLVSHSAGSANAMCDGPSVLTSISADGNWIAFASTAGNLLPGPAAPSPTFQLYLFERATGRITLVSRRAGDGRPAGGASFSTALSADGRFLAFGSLATDLLPQPLPEGSPNIFLFDRVAGTTVLVSRSAFSPSQAGNAQSVVPVMSADGRWVAYLSKATDLVAGQSDSNQSFDVFLFDRLTGTTTLASHARGSALAAGDGAADERWIDLSADGRYLAYASLASDLVAGVTDGLGQRDVFLYDRIAGTNTLVDRAAGSGPAPDPLGADKPVISADGSVVAYLQRGFDSPASQAFLFDRATGRTTPVTRPNGDAGEMALSRDGRLLLYASTATDLVPGQIDTPDTGDAFLYDRVAGTTVLVSHLAGSPRRAGANQVYVDIALSADGSWALYSSYAAGLDAGRKDLNNQTDVFLYERARAASRAITLRVPDLVSSTPNDSSYAYVISGDGRYVAFTSATTDLVPGNTDRNGTYDAFLYDRTTGRTILVSRSGGSPRVAANADSTVLAISRDGSSILFGSRATDLVPRQSGPAGQLFLFNRLDGTTSLVSHASASLRRGSNQGGGFGLLSADGGVVVFNSFSTDLVKGLQDDNLADDVFSWDRRTGAITLVSHAFGSPLKTASSDSGVSSLSPDGTWIGLTSTSRNLLPDIPSPTRREVRNAFLYNRGTGAGFLLSRPPGGGLAVGGFQPVVSADGRYAAFLSTAALAPGQPSSPSPVPNVFLLDRQTGALTLVSRAPGAHTALAGLSDNGRFVLFSSDAADLAPGQDDTNGRPDLFRFDRATGAIRLVSHAPGLPNTAIGLWQGSPLGSLSANGQRVAFLSEFPDLLPDPQTDETNVFVWDALSGKVTLASHALDSPTRPGNRGSQYPLINAGGNAVVFGSSASDLVTGDLNGWEDVFVYVPE